ncbi:MAG: hypothetical protein KM310_06440 [Clostridiales bacterium]|nr:hypothetical protein [Clostridiales bacterium]
MASMVASLPAPPATYAQASGDIFRLAASSSFSGCTGTRGRRPAIPAM